MTINVEYKNRFRIDLRINPGIVYGLVIYYSCVLNVVIIHWLTDNEFQASDRMIHRCDSNNYLLQILRQFHSIPAGIAYFLA